MTHLWSYLSAYFYHVGHAIRSTLYLIVDNHLQRTLPIAAMHRRNVLFHLVRRPGRPASQVSGARLSFIVCFHFTRYPRHRD